MYLSVQKSTLEQFAVRMVVGGLILRICAQSFHVNEYFFIYVSVQYFVYHKVSVPAIRLQLALYMY